MACMSGEGVSAGDIQRAAGDDVLRAAVALARQQAEAGDLSGARAALEQALAAGTARLGEDHPDLTPAMIDLATIAQRMGNLTEAQRQLGVAYRILRATRGAEDRQALDVEDRLAVVSHALGEPTGPLDWHLVDVGGRILGPDHPAIRAARARLDDTVDGAAEAAGLHSSGGTAHRAGLPPSTSPFAPDPRTPGVFGRRPAPAATFPAARTGSVSADGLYSPAGYTEAPPDEAWAPDYDGGWAGDSRPATDPWAAQNQFDGYEDEPQAYSGEWSRRSTRLGRVLTWTVAVLAAAALGVALAFIAEARDRAVQQRQGATAPTAGATKGGASPTPAPTVPSAAVPSKPADVKIKDDGATVTLTWRDPTDGTVTFVVAGSRKGTTSAPMQSVPAGRTKATIYGLNPKFDYCFTVAAVYSAELVAPSSRVCTDRLSTGGTT
jgi:hypothetical protein